MTKKTVATNLEQIGLIGNVLVLDDDKEAARQLAGLFVRALPCSARGIANPGDAIALASGGKCDLLVTDLRMPGRDGLTVLAEIKALSPRCEVIVLTAYQSMNSAIDAMRIGAIDYISRDATADWLDALFDRARQVLQTRPSGRAPGFHRENLIHFFLDRLNNEKESKGIYGKFPQGLALEYAVKLLLESCDGFGTTWHRRKTATEEHDIVGLNQVKQGFWSRQGPIVLVECKDRYASRPGAPDRGRFEQKIRNRQGHSTAGLFVSTGGFAKTFSEQKVTTAVPGGPIPIVVSIDNQALLEWVVSFDRLAWLTEKTIAAVF